MSNRNLHAAKSAANDEFYTPLNIIENEVMHYREHFKDKVVYLNCDDPRESAFFFYFSMNFERLGLKKLISSCYKNQDFNLFSMHDKKEEAVWLEYNGAPEGHRMPTIESIGVNKFKGDGDFRNQENIELLKQADIVVTNPPFSLFREYVAQLIEYDKKFLIIGSANAITYKDFFPLLKDNKVWQGVNSSKFRFIVPNDTDNKKAYEEDGKKYVDFGNTTWWTNLEYPRRKQDMILFRDYYGNEEKYPTYDNYDAINVDKIADIPRDYKGIMGVPIGIFDKYNPEQFEIIDGIGRYSIIDNEATKKQKKYLSMINGEAKYFRVIIQNKYLNPEIYGHKNAIRADSEILVKVMCEGIGILCIFDDNREVDKVDKSIGCEYRYTITFKEDCKSGYVEFFNNKYINRAFINEVKDIAGKILVLNEKSDSILEFSIE